MNCTLGDPCSIPIFVIAALIMYGPAIGHLLFWVFVGYLVISLLRTLDRLAPPPPNPPPPPPPRPNPKGTWWTRYEVNQFLKDLRDHPKR